MRQSKLFGKTTKTISKELKTPSHRFLIQGGFIQESVAGRYYFLPLGMKVRDKIMRIIEREMDKAGAEKIEVVDKFISKTDESDDVRKMTYQESEAWYSAISADMFS